jgi:hypothetical protein
MSSPKRGTKRPHAGAAALLSVSRRKKGDDVASTAASTPLRASAADVDADAVTQPHMWRTLNYSGFTTPTVLSAHEVRMLALINERCVVPLDFDVERSFGPLAGLSRERRLISAFNWRLLRLKDETTQYPNTICLDCGGDHASEDCRQCFAPSTHA